MRELFLKIAKIFSAQVIAALCMGLILLLTARSLGPFGRGIIATLVAFGTAIARLASLSLGVIVISENQGGIQREKLREHFSIVLSYSMFASVVMLILSALMYQFDSVGVFSSISFIDFLVGVLTIPFLLWEEYVSNFLTSLNRVETYNRNMVEGRLLGLILVVLLMFSGYLTITSTLWILLIIRVYTVVTGLWVVRDELKQSLFWKLQGLSPILRDGLKFHLMPLGILLLSNVDVLMVKSICGVEITGQYQFAAQITTLVLLAVHSAAMVFMSQLSQASAMEIWQRYRKAIYFFIASITGFAGICALIVPPLIILLVGDDFAPAGTLLLWMLIPMVLKSVSIIFTHQWVGRKLYWQASVATVLVGSINIVVALLLLPVYGAVGAVIAATIAQLVSTAMNIAMIYYCNRSESRRDYNTAYH